MDIFGTRQVKVCNPINYLEITFICEFGKDSAL